MKKIIIMLSMIIGMNHAYSAQVTYVKAVSLEELQMPSDGMMGAMSQNNRYMLASLDALDATDRALFYGTMVTVVLQFIALLVLKKMQRQGANIILEKIPLAFGFHLRFKYILTNLAIMPLFIAIAITYIVNKRFFFPHLKIQVPLALSILMGCDLNYKLLNDDVKKYFLKLREETPLIIKSKIDFDADSLIDKPCLICYGELKDPIRCCDRENHVYCTECLTNWFKEIEKISRQNAFKCIACAKKITRDNARISINRFEIEKPNKLDLTKALLAGSMGIFLALALANICYILFQLSA